MRLFGSHTFLSTQWQPTRGLWKRRSELRVRTAAHFDRSTRLGILLMIPSRCRSAVLFPGVLCCASLLFSVVCLAASAASLPMVAGVEFDARNQEGTVLVRGAARLRAGQVLVLSTTKDYGGKPLARPRMPRVVFETDRNPSFSIEAGARLVIEGEPGQPVTWLTEPADPLVKPLVKLGRGAETELRHVSFINIALRVEGEAHSLSDVSVQFAGDQPAFTFAGTRGTFDHLFVHHSTWGFSFEPLEGQPCDLTIRDSSIRSCVKGTGGSTYLAGGSLRSALAPDGRKHQVRFIGVDWDSLWDDLTGTELRASGQRPRIVAMGDSIAQGCCRYVNFWNYLPGNDDIEHSWPYQLQLRLPEFFVINKGEGGYLTTQMMARLPGIIEKIRPQYCYLGGGTNDMRANFPPGQIVRNYRTMWLEMRRAGIVPIQLAITPNNVHPDWETRIKQTNALLKDACERESVRFEDVYSLLVAPSGWGLDPAYDPGDGLHPNKKGYKRMADSLFVPVHSGGAQSR
jgi:lysophospholipase L1-like esterase